MQLPPGLAERLAEKTNEQLCQMLAEAAVYLPEVIEAARVELRRRGLTPERIAQIQTAAQARLAEQYRAEAESRRRAGWAYHVGSFLLHGIFRWGEVEAESTSGS